MILRTDFLHSLDHIDPQLVFKGVPSCRVFSTLSYSSLSCPFGCLGYGDCAEACPFDAIVVENGVARIDTPPPTRPPFRRTMLKTLPICKPEAPLNMTPSPPRFVPETPQAYSP